MSDNSDDKAVAKIGRPSLYKPEYCESVIEWGAMGKSLTWMAAEIGVSRDTIHEWIKVHPAFSDATKRAMAKSQQWWEDAGQGGILMPGFSAAGWAKNMACRFSAEWRDKTETALVGADGGPVKTESTVTISPEDAYKLMLSGDAKN